jgi:conjugal transfer/entry exclusion protein
MDVASTGQAAAQISTLQRAQQASISGLRSSQLQAQSLASVLAQSADATKTVQPPAQPSQSGNGGGTGGGGQASSNAGQPSGSTRGSLVNILV